jgi:hypothetical protein
MEKLEHGTAGTLNNEQSRGTESLLAERKLSCPFSITTQV